MKVGQRHRQGLEMTEATPKVCVGVYDIIHPSPPSLKNLSVMAINVELLRDKVNQYRTSLQLLEEFRVNGRLGIENTRIKSILLPSTIYETIDNFFRKFSSSVDFWIDEHYKRVFHCYRHQNYILQCFDDFVCDHDGSVHYARTAERMMRCVGFNSEIKFKIACLYFFEEDIRLIWPSVSRHLSVELINFYESPQLYYWICRLRNELNKIPTRWDEIVDERMFKESMPYNRPSVEYFWYKIPLEKQMLNTGYLHEMNLLRFILPKLNERQLYEFANFTARGGFYAMFLHFYSREGVTILRTWQYIKNLMNERAFKLLIVNLIELAGYNCDFWIELWNDTPLTLTQSVIRLISSESKWLDDMKLSITLGGVTNNLIHGKFLHHILQAASVVERNSFWHNCWETLIEALRTKDLQRIMQLCFENEDDITQFKQNVMVNSPVALRVCVLLLEGANFDELNALVSFFHLESQIETHFKQQILQSAFHDEVLKFSRQIFYSTKKFYDFVKDISAEFKINLLVSSPSFLKRLSIFICGGGGISLKTLTEFVDTFISTEVSEEDFTLIKTKLIQSLKDYITLVVTTVSDHDDLFRMPKFNSILLWCLGTNEAVQEFKLTCVFGLSRI